MLRHTQIKMVALNCDKRDYYAGECAAYSRMYLMEDQYK